jgi:hypothetical protein
MTTPDDPAAQLLCEHRWVRATPETDEPHCTSCALSYRAYVEGTVMAALARMDAL